MQLIPRCALVLVATCWVCGAAISQSTPVAGAVATVPAGVPLRVQIDRRTPLKAGGRVNAHLIAPIFLFDHEVIPLNAHLTGTIESTHSVPGAVRANALLNGDFTPLAVAEVRFDHLVLADGTSIALQATAIQRDAGIVRMRASGAKRPSMRQQVTEQVKQRKQDALDTITKPGKVDRIRRYVYMQLPYHPQEIWAGTQYDVDLTAALAVPDSHSVPLPLAEFVGDVPTGTVEARLTQGLSSRTDKQGARVNAVVTRPLFDAEHRHLLLPQGTQLSGTVQQVKAARWFARNGRLRFTFREMSLPEDQQQRAVHGQMSAAEADAGQNLIIDSEGGTRADSGRNKYLAPLALGVLAASASDNDGNLAVKGGVASNGFGIIARVVAMAAANSDVSSGFAYFALSKSIYKRWIAKGHEVEFPRDTRLQIDLSER